MELEDVVAWEVEFRVLGWNLNLALTLVALVGI